MRDKPYFTLGDYPQKNYIKNGDIFPWSDAEHEYYVYFNEQGKELNIPVQPWVGVYLVVEFNKKDARCNISHKVVALMDRIKFVSGAPLKANPITGMSE